MSKIVLDARESGTSSGRYIDKLIENLSHINHGHQLVVLAKASRIKEIKKFAKDVKVVETRHKEFTFAEQTGLLKQIRDLKADLVFFPMPQQPILYRGSVVTTMNDLTTVRFRNPAKNWLIFTIKQLVYKRVIKITARKSRALLTFTEFVKDDIAKFARINSRKITVTYPAADPIKDAPAPVEDLVNKRFIMYVGQSGPHKNLARLVDAFETLRQEFPELHLVLAGKQNTLYKRLAKDVRQRALAKVHFTGFVSEGELRWLYENCEAYVFPSLSEGFGLPGLEAMIHGAPVVSSSATCLPEVYQDAAAYFDPESVDDIADKITLVLKDEKLRKGLVQNGKKVAGKYSWQRMAEETLEVFNKVLN